VAEHKCAEGGCEKPGYTRHSLGIYAGRWCDQHWKTSGYRDEPASAFDPADAGETWGDDDDCW
jgi:ribosomal protein L37AE/L43A